MYETKYGYAEVQQRLFYNIQYMGETLQGPTQKVRVQVCRGKQGCSSYLTSAVHRLVSFQNDYSRAVIQLFVVLCCFPGSRVLLRKGTDIPEGDLTQPSWIRQALPLERSWLDPAVVEPRSYCCYFNCGSGRQKNKKVPLQ
jgi:hypothetical protein